MWSRGRKETIVSFVLGLFCGCTVVRFLLSTSETPATTQKSHPVDEKALRAPSPQLKTGDRPLKVTSELVRSKKSLFIAIRTRESNLPTRASAINATWLRNAAENSAATFLVPSNAETHRKKFNIPIENLSPLKSLASTPPHQNLLSVFRYLASSVADDFDWFLIVSDNAYVRPRKLIDYLRKLDPTGDVYLGQPGLGAPEHRDTLQLKSGEVFCMTGPGIVVSRAVLKRIDAVIESCLSDKTPSSHEAVELGRCLSRHVGIQCAWAYELEKLFYIDYTGKLFMSELSLSNMRLLKALSVYPVNNPYAMRNTHKFYRSCEVQEYQELVAKLQQEMKKH